MVRDAVPLKNYQGQYHDRIIERLPECRNVSKNEAEIIAILARSDKPLTVEEIRLKHSNQDLNFRAFLENSKFINRITIREPIQTYSVYTTPIEITNEVKAIDAEREAFFERNKLPYKKGFFEDSETGDKIDAFLDQFDEDWDEDFIIPDDEEWNVDADDDPTSPYRERLGDVIEENNKCCFQTSKERKQI